MNNKQGSLDKPVTEDLKKSYYDLYRKADNIYKDYEFVVDNGISKEIARGAMPQNIMTEFVWKSDLHNFIKMIRLRVHLTAQKEIRDLVEAMKELVKPMFPVVFNAFEKFWLNSISFSKEEIDIIKKGRNKDGNFESFMSKRKNNDFNKKIKLLGL